MPVIKKTTTEKEKAVKRSVVKTDKVKKPIVKPKKAAAVSSPEEVVVPALPLASATEAPLASLENDLEIEAIEGLSEGLLKAGGKTKYIEAIGRRKTSTARVRLYTQGRKGIIVNNKPYTEYFPKFLHKTIEDSLEKLKCLGKFGATVVVRGGGLSGQAEALRHGLARTLVILNPYFKKRLKKSGYLTRDPRMRERKKPGLKRARRAPQWSKR